MLVFKTMKRSGNFTASVDEFCREYEGRGIQAGLHGKVQCELHPSDAVP